MIIIRYRGTRIEIDMPDGPIHDPEDNSAYLCIIDENPPPNCRAMIQEGHYTFTNESPFEWQKEILDLCKAIVDAEKE